VGHKIIFLFEKRGRSPELSGLCRLSGDVPGGWLAVALGRGGHRLFDHERAG